MSGPLGDLFAFLFLLGMLVCAFRIAGSLSSIVYEMRGYNSRRVGKTCSIRYMRSPSESGRMTFVDGVLTKVE